MIDITALFILQHRTEVTTHYHRSPKISKDVWIKRERGKSEVVSGLSASSKNEESQGSLYCKQQDWEVSRKWDGGAHKGQNETPKKSHHPCQSK